MQRQLRKRLTEYFACDGIDHEIRIEIPLGSYLPAFTSPALEKKVPADAGGGFAQDQPRPAAFGYTLSCVKVGVGRAF